MASLTSLIIVYTEPYIPTLTLVAPGGGCATAAEPYAHKSSGKKFLVFGKDYK